MERKDLGEPSKLIILKICSSQCLIHNIFVQKDEIITKRLKQLYENVQN